MSYLLDLDDQLLTVRSADARAFIADAVACYRTGALRPAIVSLWTAVLYDIIAKARELDLTGDPTAKAFVAKRASVRAANDVGKALEIERTLLEDARDKFELITHLEFEDLARLRTDRNRCAHPSENADDEPYQPTAELVRYHFRSAISYLLAHPPVQGRAALSQVHEAVKSPLFPTTAAEARRVLAAGPMQRPKDALLRNFVISAVRAILTDDTTADDMPFVARVMAALEALSAMHPAPVAAVYSAELAKIVQSVKDDRLHRVLRTGARLPVVWAHMPDEVRVKLERLVEVADPQTAPTVPAFALRTSELRPIAEARVRQFSRAELLAFVNGSTPERDVAPLVLETGLAFLASSLSFDMTNALIARVLLPIVPSIGEAELQRIVDIAAVNIEVEHAFQTRTLLTAIRDAAMIPSDRFKAVVTAADIVATLKEIAVPQVAAEIDLGPDDGAPTEGATVTVSRPHLLNPQELQPGGRVRHRRFGPGTIAEVNGPGRDQKVSIEFDDRLVGRKTLVVGAAQLEAAE